MLAHLVLKETLDHLDLLAYKVHQEIKDPLDLKDLLV